MHFSANINIDSVLASDSIQSIVLDNCDSIYHIISVSFVSPFIRLWAILPLSSITELCCMPVHESCVLCFVCVCIFILDYRVIYALRVNKLKLPKIGKKKQQHSCASICSDIEIQLKMSEFSRNIHTMS